MATIYIDNYAEIKRLWKKAPVLMEKELRVALQDALLRLEGRAVREAPVDTGHLAGAITNSIHNLTGRVHTSDGGAQVKYLYWVHEGRDAFFAKQKKVLAAKVEDASVGQRSKYSRRITKKGYIIFGKRVRAQKANPFFDRAAQKEEKAINAEFEKAVHRVLKKIASTK